MHSGKSILLVGGTGYVGSHLVPVLADYGWQVYTTGTKPQVADNYFVVDFEREQSFEALKGKRFQLIIILASKMTAMGTTSLTHPDLRTNTTGYAAFLHFVASFNLSDKVIYTSSMTVYGSSNNLPVNENAVIEPVHTYGLSKALAEQITHFFCLHKNIPGVVLRLPGVYGGTRQSGFIYNVADKCRRNERIDLKSEGLIFWETMHVSDLCNIVVRFINHYSWQKEFEIFNVSYGEPTDFYQTAYAIKQFLLSESDIVEIGKKGYIPFYLCNEKIKGVVTITEKFAESLKKYVGELAI